MPKPSYCFSCTEEVAWVVTAVPVCSFSPTPVLNPLVGPLLLGRLKSHLLVSLHVWVITLIGSQITATSVCSQHDHPEAFSTE